VRFAEALESRKLLDAEHTDLLVTGKVDTGHGDKYAYGFSDRSRGGVRRFGHGGGAPGMNGELTIYSQSGYVVAVLGQSRSSGRGARRSLHWRPPPGEVIQRMSCTLEVQ
jgi:hypothetical protein